MITIKKIGQSLKKGAYFKGIKNKIITVRNKNLKFENWKIANKSGEWVMQRDKTDFSKSCFVKLVTVQVDQIGYGENVSRNHEKQLYKIYLCHQSLL